MAKIPKEVQDFMQGKMGWVATASPEGVPNCHPERVCPGNRRRAPGLR